MSDVIVLEAGRHERHYWRDLWRYRELLEVLAWRDLSVRYKQTAVGVLWAIIRPLLTMLVFTVIFGRIAKLPSDGGAPYPLMVFVGMLPWTLFATSLAEASNSLINNAYLISKVYFPRLIVPIGHGGCVVCGLPHQFCNPNIALVMVLVLAQLADGISAGVRSLCGLDKHWAVPLDRGSQCEISRLSVYHAVHRSIWFLSFSSGIFL
jgi:ABC-type polysaccharide/polyol phosphate export permease